MMTTTTQFQSIDSHDLDKVTGGADDRLENAYRSVGGFLGGAAGGAAGRVGGGAAGGALGGPPGAVVGQALGGAGGAAAGNAAGSAAGSGLYRAGSFLGDQAARTTPGLWLGRQLNNIFGAP